MTDRILKIHPQKIGIGNSNRYPIYITYYSGITIDSLLKPTLATSYHNICTHRYQSIAGILNWLAMFEHPDMIPVTAFLFA